MRPAMQHCLKSRWFCVRVPVLSLSRCPTWPSCSLREVLRAWAGLSFFSQRISKSQLMKRLCTTWTTSNLEETKTTAIQPQQSLNKIQSIKKLYYDINKALLASRGPFHKAGLVKTLGLLTLKWGKLWVFRFTKGGNSTRERGITLACFTERGNVRSRLVTVVTDSMNLTWSGPGFSQWS